MEEWKARIWKEKSSVQKGMGNAEIEYWRRFINYFMWVVKDNF